MNCNDLLDFYLDKACKEASLEALKKLNNVVNTIIKHSNANSQDILRVIQIYADKARFDYERSLKSYIKATTQVLLDAQTEQKDYDRKGK